MNNASENVVVTNDSSSLNASWN